MLPRPRTEIAIAMGKNSKAEKETAMAFGYDSHAKVSGGVASARGVWWIRQRV